MKIKIDDDHIQEFPDDVAALIIADPSYGDEIIDLNASEVNVLIHGVLASIYNPTLSFEENINNIKTRYMDTAKPNKEALNVALGLIEKYKIEIEDDDIGQVGFDDMYQELKPDQISSEKK